MNTPTAKRRLELAERVCLMFGWTGADNSERGKALHELWREWRRAYEADGGSTEPYSHPELSDERIRELAAQRDATVKRTLAAIRSRTTTVADGTVGMRRGE